LSENLEPISFVRNAKDRKSIPAKIIIIGDPKVGKTSLILKYVKNQIDSEYLPTVGSRISKEPVKLLLGKEIINVSLLIWDIAGQKQFKILRKVYYNGAKGVILVFDLTNPQTLANLPDWHTEAVGFGLGNVPMVLVGNKDDLADERAVSEEDVNQVKESTGIANYFETSALTGTRVTEMFYSIAEQIFTTGTIKRR